jgi:two-component system, OmpR family, phosphate regulon response regulator PhoB
MMLRGKTETVRPPATILVVDDEDDVINLVSFNLRAAGFQVLVARDGVAALELARRERPDLIILDLMLPELDGISVCEVLRQQPASAHTPVIMLTAWATDRARLVGLQAGANDYVTKPFSPRELVRRVQSLLAEGSLRQENGSHFELKQLAVDLEQHRVSVNGTNVPLSADEFRMLTLLVHAIFKRLAPDHKPGAPT